MSQLFCPVAAKLATFDLDMDADALATVWDKPACVRCRSSCQIRDQMNFRVRDAYVRYAVEQYAGNSAVRE